MSFFQMPNIPYRHDIQDIINVTYTKDDINTTNDMNTTNNMNTTNDIDNTNRAVINKTLMSYLTRIKTEIDNRQNTWDRFKKYTNPYEYIHTTIPNTNISISKLKPLSRSY